MPNFICVTCGSQFAETVKEPASCPICEDERQYIGVGGQR
jgi:predicted Zn-ribbon and HTH transcriptional regulator